MKLTQPEKNEKIIVQAQEKARALFQTKRANCAESVFRAIYESVETDLPPQVSSLVTPLGGGVGISGENCGALLAGAMALALVYGREDHGEALEEHRQRLWKVYALYNQLPHRFKEKYGSLRCWDLTKPYIYGTQKCRKFCKELIAETAGMVAELLLEAKQKDLDFRFQENLLQQTAEATGLSIEELICLKEKGEPFPEPGVKK
jgi:C_GCAxxG_C_C family probable redox protein